MVLVSCLPLIFPFSKTLDFRSEIIDFLDVVFQPAGSHFGGCADKETQGNQHEKNGIYAPE
jgi:hypothetical protein